MDTKYEMPKGSLISFFSNKIKIEGGINLAQGIPGYAPPADLLEQLSNQAKDPGIHQYAPGIGNFRLLDLLAERYSREMTISRDNLLIVQGATEAISLLYIYLRKKRAGSFTVMAFDPVYESYNNLPAIFGDRFVTHSFADDGTIDFFALEEKIKNEKPGLFFMNSPGNPYGRVFSREESMKMLELSSKYGFNILFDAVYRELYFKEPPYIPLDHCAKNLFYVNSFSKLFSITGWRVGYLICDASHMKEIRAIHDYTGLCVPSVLQIALAGYIQQYNWGETYVAELRIRLRKSLEILTSTLVSLGFHVPPVDGGYFIWSEMPEQCKDSFAFAVDLYEQEKVAVIPGIHFSPKANRIIRFNMAREESELIQGCEGLKHFFGR